MNAAAQKNSLRFEKNMLAARRDGTDKMRDSRVVQRLASANPNDRRGTSDDVANLFVGNGMRGTGVQQLRRIGKRKQSAVLRTMEDSREADFL